jgi:zinc and cadmium transporter
VSPAANAILAVLLVSAISLIGVVTVSRDPAVLRRRLPLLVSLAAGVLVGGAMLHLLPEAIEALGAESEVFLLFLGGFLGFFVLERYLWFHHHGRHFPGGDPDADPHPTGHGLGQDCDEPHPVVIMNLVGDGAHNLIDGMAIGAAFLIDPAAGIATTIAIALHEIPQELGDFGVLVHGGLSVRRALLFNVLSGLVAVLGVAVALVVGQRVEGFSAALLPITAGSFVYIAAADLIPEIHRHRDRSRAAAQALFLFVGVGLTLVLRLQLH